MHKAWVTLYTYVSTKNIILDLTLLFIYLFILFIYLFKVNDIPKILHAQKIYIKLSNTRIWCAN